MEMDVGRPLDLISRPCKNCQKEFKILSKSKQEFCSKICEFSYKRKPGREKEWQEATREMRKTYIGMSVWKVRRKNEATK